MSIELNGTTGIDFNDGSNQSTSATPYGRKNLIINGDMQIAQRGTSFTVTGGDTAYRTVDRWKHVLGAGNWVVSQDTDVPTGQGFAKSLKLDVTSAVTSPAAGLFTALQYSFEGQHLQHLKKGTASAESVTLSFWVKATKTGTYIVELDDDDNGRNINKSYTVNASDTWEKKTITFEGDTTGTLNNDNGLSLRIFMYLVMGTDYTSGTLQTSWGSTVSANRAVGQVNTADSASNNFYITGVQLEVGDAASDFEFIPYDMELARCQRYYWRWTATRDLCSAMLASTVSAYGVFAFPVKMRANPTIATEATTNVRVSWSGGTSVTSGFAIDRNSDTSCLIRLTTSGLTAGQGAWYVVDGGSISGSAEL